MDPHVSSGRDVWDHFAVGLGWFGSRLGMFLRLFGDGCGIVLGPCWDGFGIVLGPFGNRFGIVLGISLGSSWARFGHLFFRGGGVPPLTPIGRYWALYSKKLPHRDQRPPKWDSRAPGALLVTLGGPQPFKMSLASHLRLNIALGTQRYKLRFQALVCHLRAGQLRIVYQIHFGYRLHYFACGVRRCKRQKLCHCHEDGLRKYPTYYFHAHIVAGLDVWC